MLKYIVTLATSDMLKCETTTIVWKVSGCALLLNLMAQNVSSNEVVPWEGNGKRTLDFHYL